MYFSGAGKLLLYPTAVHRKLRQKKRPSLSSGFWLGSYVLSWIWSVDFDCLWGSEICVCLRCSLAPHGWPITGGMRPAICSFLSPVSRRPILHTAHTPTTRGATRQTGAKAHEVQTMGGAKETTGIHLWQGHGRGHLFSIPKTNLLPAGQHARGAVARWRVEAYVVPRIWCAWFIIPPQHALGPTAHQRRTRGH